MIYLLTIKQFTTMEAIAMQQAIKDMMEAGLNVDVLANELAILEMTAEE